MCNMAFEIAILFSAYMRRYANCNLCFLGREATNSIEQQNKWPWERYHEVIRVNCEEVIFEITRCLMTRDRIEPGGKVPYCGAMNGWMPVFSFSHVLLYSTSVSAVQDCIMYEVLLGSSAHAEIVVCLWYLPKRPSTPIQQFNDH